jgi:hypothetical protein
MKEIQSLSGHVWCYRERDLGEGFKLEVLCDAHYVTTVDTYAQLYALLSFVWLTAQGTRMQKSIDTEVVIPLTDDQALMFNRREAR